MEVAAGLSITRINVPDVVAVGEGGWFQCEFTKGESVYALKWYLGLDEFYRWTPAETPAIRTFPVKGNPLTVDKAASNRGRIKIQNFKLGATGLYRCEVSAEAPSFHTETAVATLSVVDLPDEKPRIVGVQSAYQVHEEVTVNCSSYNSFPPATLSFYVNDEPAEPSWVTHYPPTEDPESGLKTSVLGLQFPLRPNLLLSGGRAMVKCTAAIGDNYWESSVVAVHSDTPHQASVMEGRASSSPSHGAAVMSAWWVVRVVAVMLLLHLQ
ncbi:hypothetical protein Pmani_008335 [Petrolisthes manimaculis]|uniref:Ig-like domain-containing protein n=1 Tax=Petrolisthes manimaculis TaxID=1843537 RepID=A0AAE1UDZ9_9EUCA|nr:hypothetical protein Pmani_008335 [Petrolisthes manimaculis]